MPDNGPIVPERARSQRHIYDREQWLVLVAAGAVIVAGLVATVWLLTAAALAHSWYDPYCCNNNDCGPIVKAEQRDGKWYYTNATGKPVAVDAETRFLTSKDHNTHSCEWYGKLRCLYIPGGN